MARQKIHWDLWKQVAIASFYSKRQVKLMIVRNLKVFSQNVCKNSVIINTILETQNQFDIILIQELP